jgi:trk system potassium uptake protein TrkH
MGVIAYFYGFPQTPQSAFLCNIVIHCSLIFYVLKYFLSALFSVHSKKYIFKHKYQGIMIFLIILWFVFSYGFNFQHKFFNAIDIKNIGSMTMLIIQLYFFVMMLFDLSSIGQLFSKLKLGPGGWMISSFIFLISTGTVLLLLPEMTTGGISFIDALFTATSASCVTGLVTLNVATAFTFKGYIVILLLIQFGGINIVAFATFLSSFYVEKKLRYQSVMKEMLSTSLNGTQTLIKEILIYTFAIEIIGTLAFFLYWNHYHFYSDSVFDNLFLSIFHAISAFNNAGISFIDGGMTAPLFRWDHYTQIITGFLIFLGGIGFITIHNMLFSVRYNPNKLKYWSRLQVMSRLTLKVTLFQLAYVDGNLNQAELSVLQSISLHLNVSQQDFLYIKNTYFYYAHQQSSFYERHTHTTTRSNLDSDYAILGVSVRDSNEDIKKAYRRLAIENHPDKIEHLGEVARKKSEENFKKINQAYQRIKKQRNL